MHLRSPLAHLLIRSAGLASATTLTAVSLLASPQVTNEDIPRDQLKGRWMNFESTVLDGFVSLRGSSLVWTINQAGSRLTSIDRLTLEITDEVPIGLGVVSIQRRPGTSEIWLVDRVAASVSVFDLATGQVTSSIRTGPEPHGIAFTPSGDRAYVTCSALGTVDVIRCDTLEVVQSLAISAKHPRAIREAGGKIFVVPTSSGNGTAPLGTPGDPDDVQAVARVSDYPGTNPLPDRDLFVIEPGAQPGTATLLPWNVSGLGTTLYNIHARPGTNELWIPNTEALNSAHTGEVNFLGGQVVSNRVTVVDATDGSLLQIIDLDALAPIDDARVAPPTSISFLSDGSRAFVSGYGSNIIGVLDADAASSVTWAGSIRVRQQQDYPDGAGPRSIAIDATDQYLWTLNRGDATFSRVSLAQLPTAPSFSYFAPKAKSIGWDPTPADINQGRVHFNRTQNSESQTSSCASCHIDGGSDYLAWDLSTYLDLEGTPSDELIFGVDVKGPMVTQSLRRAKEVGPFHWRGERKNLMDFDSTFMNLFEREEDGELQGLNDDFMYIAQFLEHLTLLPNPRGQVDRQYTQEELEGADIFLNKPVLDGLKCVDCHVLPLGTGGEIVSTDRGGIAPTIVVPQLRGVADKLSPPHNAGRQFGTRTELGAGLNHGGNVSGIRELLEEFAPDGSQRFELTSDEIDKLIMFLAAFDTGLAPAAGYQATASASNLASFRVQHINFLTQQVLAGNCDVVFRYGPVQHLGSPRYMTGLYDPTTGNWWQGSEALPQLTLGELMNIALSTPVTFLGVPVLMGEPMGVDRDNDKLWDLDELIAGTDPENDDTDGDGLYDGYEVQWSTDPLTADGSNHPDTNGPQVVGPVRVVYTTTNAIKLEFETDEPARVLFSYNDGPYVLRAPLFPKHDVAFSEVLSELDPSTPYTVRLDMYDPAGNWSSHEFETGTLGFVKPDPLYVEDIELDILSVPGTQVSHWVRARVDLRIDDLPPMMPGYNVTARLYYQADSGDSPIMVAPDLQTWLVQSSGRVNFYAPIPAQVTPGSGDLTFVVERIGPPPGMPPYVEAYDLVGSQKINF